MVMTRQPAARRTRQNRMMEDDDDEFHDYHVTGTKRSVNPRHTRMAPPPTPARAATLGGASSNGSPSVYGRVSPEPVAARSSKVASARAAAAACDSPRSGSGLSLYEELLRFHREHPEAIIKVEEETANGTILPQDDDRKPAARPRPPPPDRPAVTPSPASDAFPTDRAAGRVPPRNGTYRMPVSREYFAYKDHEFNVSSPTTRGNARPPSSLLLDSLHQQVSMPALIDCETPPSSCRNSVDTSRSSSTLASSSLPLPFADSYQDLAEDEALARQLQAEEAERIETARRTVEASAALPADALVTPAAFKRAQRKRQEELEAIERDERLAAQFAALLTNHHRAGSPPRSHMPTSQVRSAPPFVDRVDAGSVAVGIDGGNGLSSDDDAEDVLKQQRILDEIRAAKEREQLEWALQESKRLEEERRRVGQAFEDIDYNGQNLADSSCSASRRWNFSCGKTNDRWDETSSASFKGRTGGLDYHSGQRSAERGYGRRQDDSWRHGQAQQLPSRTTGHVDVSGGNVPPAHSPGTTDSDDEDLLLRGEEETEEAIRSGQAHVVECRGCSGRLQAPVHYSWVWCPSCGHISPVDGIPKSHGST